MLTAINKETLWSRKMETILEKPEVKCVNIRFQNKTVSNDYKIKVKLLDTNRNKLLS